MIDVMAMPNAETLEFAREISLWIDHDEDTQDGKKFVFKPDTPRNILKRFEEIKAKLPFYDKLAS